MSKPKQTWHKGPPPHIGWWNASVDKDTDAWRWWNGECWSIVVWPHDNSTHVKIAPSETFSGHQSKIKWTDYWPKHARVPRIDPRTFPSPKAWACVDDFFYQNVMGKDAAAEYEGFMQVFKDLPGFKR